MLVAFPWKKAILLLAVLALLLLPSLSFAYFGMGSMEGSTGNCLFMPGHSAALCQSNPLDHIQEMQSMFNTLPQGNTTLTVLLLLAAGVAIASFLKNLFSRPLTLALSPVSTYQFVPRRSALQEAYSCGILNTKAF